MPATAPNEQPLDQPGKIHFGPGIQFKTNLLGHWSRDIVLPALRTSSCLRCWHWIRRSECVNLPRRSQQVARMLRCSDLFIRLRGAQAWCTDADTHMYVYSVLNTTKCTSSSQKILLLLVKDFQGSLKVQGKEISQGYITHDFEVALLYKLMWVTMLQQVLQA